MFSGVDHQFLRFWPISSGKKIGVFLKNQCYDKMLFFKKNQQAVSEKTPNF
jgi:hypothetical protein